MMTKSLFPLAMASALVLSMSAKAQDAATKDAAPKDSAPNAAGPAPASKDAAAKGTASKDAEKKGSAKASKSKITADAASSSKGGDCTFEIHVGDEMAFNIKVKDKVEKLVELNIPEACRNQETKFKLVHGGKLPKVAMGHNFVVHDLAKQQAIVTNALTSGAGNGFMPTTKDGVLGVAPTVGGGESSNLSLAKGSFKDGVNYGFVCTFAGHAPLMNGKITFIK